MRTGTKVAIRSACLELCYILLSQTTLLVEPEEVLPDGYRGHAICIVRDAAETGSTLSRRERLPPRVCPARASVDCNQLGFSAIQERKGTRTCSPVHHISRSLWKMYHEHQFDKMTRVCAPSGPKNSISGLLYKSTRRSLMPGL